MDGDTVAAPGAVAMPAADLGRTAADKLRATFTQWQIYGKDDIWWAMRSGYVALRGPQSLLCLFLCAASLEEMALKLRRQEWLRTLTPAQLEPVWRQWLATVLVEAVPR